MKSILIILALCLVTFQTSGALGSKELKECLEENGLPANIHSEVGKGNFESPILKDIPEVKIACVIACSFEKRIRESNSLNAAFVKAVDKDQNVSDSMKKEMFETLSRCNTSAKGENCKFLHCIRITKPPFVHLIVNHRDK